VILKKELLKKRARKKKKKLERGRAEDLNLGKGLLSQSDIEESLKI